MNTKRVMHAFMLLAIIIIPLLLGINFEVFSVFIDGRKSNNMAASASEKNNDDETPTLDFAIIGFSKTGTTFLHHLLANHSQVIMYDREFWGYAKALRIWLNETVEKTILTDLR